MQFEEHGANTFAAPALKGCIVTIGAMGTQPNIAQAIRDRGAEYILSVKDNQPKLTDSVRDFFAVFLATPERTPHRFDEVVPESVVFPDGLR